jgi:hypothetical protein
MEVPMFCSSCGSEVKPDALFCVSCGTEQPQPAAADEPATISVEQPQPTPSPSVQTVAKASAAGLNEPGAFADGPQPTSGEPDPETGGVLYKGYSGNLVLTERGIILRRGAKGMVVQRTLRGVKEIPYDSIVAVQFKKPGVTVGYLQFSLRGGSEAKSGVLQGVRDENTITFARGGTSKRFEEARDVIQWRIDHVKGQRLQPTHAAPRDSVAKLSELSELHEKGVLSDDEFRAAKQRLLSDL